MPELKKSTPLDRLIRQQVIERGVRDPRVLDALRQVPRVRFDPAARSDPASVGRAASIGHGQTISEIYIVALMTQHLALHPDHTVLELGTGSGYQTAVLSLLAREIFSVERVKPLLDEAFERLLSMNLRNIHFRFGDGTLGWPDHAPFDRILIAAAAPRLPEQLLQAQLADGGIAVLPIGPQDAQTLVEVKRVGSKLKTSDICACRFVKLIGQEGWPAPDEPG